VGVVAKGRVVLPVRQRPEEVLLAVIVKFYCRLAQRSK
jgi:hypothetical protein